MSVPWANSTSCVVGAAVGAVGQPAAVRRGARPRTSACSAAPRRSGTLNGPSVSSSGAVVLVQLERALDQLLVAPAVDTICRNSSPAPIGAYSSRPRRRVGPGPAGDRNRLLARRVGERVAERHEVEEVVGVEVADQDRVDVDVVAVAGAASRTRRCRSRAAARYPPSSIRYPLHAPPASCHAGDFPSTVIRTPLLSSGTRHSSRSCWDPSSVRRTPTRRTTCRSLKLERQRVGDSR